MTLNISTIKLGASVKVKKGIKAPDFDYQSMEGWQGKVTDIQKEDGLIEIEWDTQTLLETPYDYLHDIISEGYDYELMNLSIDELEPATKRLGTNKEKTDLESKIYWIDLYDHKEKNQKYGVLFKGISPTDYYQLYKKWEEHLTKNLQFPFKTEVSESERGSLRVGTKIKLLNLDGYDDMYGILGVGKSQSGSLTFPICNLEALDKTTSNYELLRDYVIWFANM